MCVSGLCGVSCIIMQMNCPSGRQTKGANSGRVPQKQEENFAKMRTITKTVLTHTGTPSDSRVYTEVIKHYM